MAKKNSAMVKEQDDWQAESDLRCMMDCEKIEKDPKRLKAVKDLAKKKLLEVAAIAGDTE